MKGEEVPEGTGDELRCITKSPEETVALGVKLGKFLKAGDLVCLSGDLGAGKTCLAGGLVRGMGVEAAVVTSPSFIMVNQYRGRFPIYHIDLYRLGSVADVEDIGFRDYLQEDSVTIIEWASRIEGDLPEDRFDIVLSHISDSEREITLVLRGQCYKDRSQEVAALMKDA